MAFIYNFFSHIHICEFVRNVSFEWVSGEIRATNQPYLTIVWGKFSCPRGCLRLGISQLFMYILISGTLILGDIDEQLNKQVCYNFFGYLLWQGGIISRAKLLIQTDANTAIPALITNRNQQVQLIKNRTNLFPQGEALNQASKLIAFNDKQLCYSRPKLTIRLHFNYTVNSRIRTNK